MVTSKQSAITKLRHTLLGAPIPTSKAHHQRLSPLIGLPVFSSDALSSVAYATEAILGILVLGSAALLPHQIWISLAIVLLIAMVAISYRQTIFAYPSGGGSYIVATDNLGEKLGLIAGAALLIDYVLTVAVSVAAGIAAIHSAVPAIGPYIVEISILCIFVVAWANLRGVRESGALFAVPTYGFILSMYAMLAVGLYRALTSGPTIQHVAPDPDIGKEAGIMLWFLILRAFAAGCTALSGIEAVSNGVQAFKAPESKNAAKTLTWMALILATLFMGVGYLALHLPVVALHSNSDPRYMTLTAQIAQWAFGRGSGMFYTIQVSTAAILILAANTAFADFPRLTSLIARDGYLPRYLARQGDRLVFHNGIIVLAVLASALIWKFHGELDFLLPLYAVGVFTAFTLSQFGMVQHWRKLRQPGWQKSAAINFMGATLSGIVLMIIAFTKFMEGAWMILVFLSILVPSFLWVKSRYRGLSKSLEIGSAPPAVASGHLALLLVPRVNRGMLPALNYARSLKGDCQAVHVTINEKLLPELQRKWQQYGDGIPLVVLPSPFRSLIQPILEYVDEVRENNPNVLITVIVAESVSSKWYHALLTEPVALRLKNSLKSRRNVVVANVRYFLEG